MTKLYNAFVLFLAKRVTSRLFKDILCLCDRVVVPSKPLRCRGDIFHKYKNVGPRQGPYSPDAIQKWQAAFKKGQFVSFEVFDDWTENTDTSNYIGLVATGDKSSRSTLTVALDAKKSELDTLESLARDVAGLTTIDYGMLESGREWDEPVDEEFEDIRERMIDTLWRDILSDYYDSDAEVRFPVSTRVARIYRGNFLTTKHLLADPKLLAKQPEIAHAESLGDVWYYRFKADPRKNTRVQRKAEKHLKMVPFTPE